MLSVLVDNAKTKPVMPRKFSHLFESAATATLKEKGRMTNEIHEPSNEPLVNYLRAHRRNAGLTQRELGQMLGYDNEGAVSRHERFEIVPPFLTALSYQIVFRVHASELFPGLTQTVELGVETRLAKFESHLREQNGGDSQASGLARKLEWLSERRSGGHK